MGYLDPVWRWVGQFGAHTLSQHNPENSRKPPPVFSISSDSGSVRFMRLLSSAGWAWLAIVLISEQCRSYVGTAHSPQTRFTIRNVFDCFNFWPITIIIILAITIVIIIISRQFHRDSMYVCSWLGKYWRRPLKLFSLVWCQQNLLFWYFQFLYWPVLTTFLLQSVGGKLGWGGLRWAELGWGLT